MSHQELDEKKEFSWSTFGLNIVWILFSGLGIAVFYYYMKELWVDYSPFIDGEVYIEKTAQVGDFIGGLVGALWAFAGIILFYLALKLQKDELKLSRAVLRDSVQAQKDTKEVMKEQLNSLKYNSNLETLNYLINDHIKTIAKINSKGLINQEEEDKRQKLQSEINQAREKLLNMAKEIIKKND